MDGSGKMGGSGNQSWRDGDRKESCLGYGINEGEVLGSELSDDNGWWRGGRRQCLCDESCGGEG